MHSFYVLFQIIEELIFPLGLYSISASSGSLSRSFLDSQNVSLGGNDHYLPCVMFLCSYLTFARLEYLQDGYHLTPSLPHLLF